MQMQERAHLTDPLSILGTSDTAGAPDQRREIHRKIAAAQAIRAEIADGLSDEDTIRDTLEGEVDFEDIVDWLLGDINYNSCLCDAIERSKTTMDTRLERLKRRTELARGLLRKALEISGQQRFERPLATVSLARKALRIGSLDESKIPAKFWKERDPTLDRDAILKALRAGEDVPGAVLAPEDMSLKIATK